MKKFSNEELKRFFEFLIMVGITAVLLSITRLETRLYTISETLAENTDFYKTLIHFALININVVLILLLGFLTFRNIVKLVVERRRGVLGSRLRTKLVLALVLFALMPTVLLFYVSTRFITGSFEQFFSEKVSQTIEQTRQVGAKVYKQAQGRLSSISGIALDRLQVIPGESVLGGESFSLDTTRLANFGDRYGVDSLQVYDSSSGLIWSDEGTPTGPNVFDQSPFVRQALEKFVLDKTIVSLTDLVSVEDHDVVQAATPIYHPFTEELLGLVLVRERFESQILKSIEGVLADFKSLKPSAQSVGLSFMVSMLLMTFLIVFSATWLGFNVAKGVAAPLQSLSEATREVALGNYEVSLSVESDDEVGQLVKAFNVMTRDLYLNRSHMMQAQVDLQHTNDQLFQRSQYLEVVLKSITGGVFSVDLQQRLLSFNKAAQKLLHIDGDSFIHQKVVDVFGEDLVKYFWAPIMRDLREKNSCHRQIDLSELGNDVILTIEATPLEDDQGKVVGLIVIFDDIREKIQVQRVEAWREVARRIAHEIKNPITPIKLSAQRLLRRYEGRFSGDDQDVFVGCIETIVAQVDGLRDLVNEFSKFARLPKVNLKRGQIMDLLSDVINFYRLTYPHIKFGLEGDHLPPYPFDKEQMRRVFTNLISNAIGALVEGREGNISIETISDEKLGIIRIEVCDNGTGIKSHLKGRVIEPYYSSKDEGTGLGLAIVNQIVSDHGGYLRIKDNEPYGTRIVVELPMERPYS